MPRLLILLLVVCLLFPANLSALTINSPILIKTPLPAKSPLQLYLSPSSGSVEVDTPISFSTVVFNPNGWQYTQSLQFLIKTPNSNSYVLFLYNVRTKRLYLRDNSGGWLGGYNPGAKAFIENSLVSLDCSQTTVRTTGRFLFIKWNLKFKPNFATPQTKYICLEAKDYRNLSTGWVKKGTWLVGINSNPLVGTITPSTGSSAVNTGVTFITSYSDPNGYQDIQTASLLINTVVDGANCFYGYYNQNTNKLYLRNDANTAWLGGYAPGSVNTIKNSYAKLDCRSTRVSGSSTTLSVNWKVTFKTPFTGTKNTYLYVKDDSNLYNDWTKVGTWTIPNSPPSVGTVLPSSGTASPDQQLSFSTTYSDPDTWLNIQYVHLLINTSVNGTNCFYGYYNQNTNKLYLRNDANTAWLGGYAPGSANVIENSYAKLDCASTTISGSGNTLTVNWNVNFKSSFTGTKNTYLYVKDDAGAYQGWLKKGTLVIQVDVTAPTGSIKINNDSQYTNSTSVTLNLSAQDNPGGSGLSQMQFSNDDSSWLSPETYATSKSWTLPSGDGTKTVYVKFKDVAGNWSEAFSDTITLDTTLPVGSIRINNDQLYTNSTSVNLNLSAVDPSSRPLTPEDLKAYFITQGLGDVVLEENGKKISEMSADELVDILAARYQLDPEKDLNFLCFLFGLTTTSSGLNQMQFSNDGSNWSTPEAFGSDWLSFSSKVWTLTSGDGTKTVYVKFSDKADNWSVAYSDTIILQTISAEVTIISPFDGYVTQKEFIAVKGIIKAPEGIDVYVNGIQAMIEEDYFLATGVPLKTVGENRLEAIAMKDGRVIATDWIRVTYLESFPPELLIDNFEDSLVTTNSLDFWTSDEQTCAENKDINGTHKITWDGTSDYWHTELFDPVRLPKGIDVSVYTALTFLIKGASGGEDFTIEIEDIPHGQVSDKRVSLSDYVNVTTEWKKVTIPLFPFVSRGIWKTQLRSLVFHFNKQAAATIYIDDIKLCLGKIDDFNDSAPYTNRMGFVTADDNSLLENKDENGYHKLSWNQVTGYWYSRLWDGQYELDGSGYNYLVLDVKGDKGNELFKIGFKDKYQEILVDISNHITINTDWQTVYIPLSAFTNQGLNLKYLRELLLRFDAEALGTIYIDNIEFSLANSRAQAKPKSQARVIVSGRRIFLDGKPFVIKGLGYQPTPIGLHPRTELLYQDPSIYNRDLPILRQMGCNTIRTWKKVNSASFLDACYNNGLKPIYVIMGFPINMYSDLSNPATREAIKSEFREYVNTYKNHPAVLVWALGNEENLWYQANISDWYSLANELAQIAYQIEGATYHPVAIVNADLENIGDKTKFADDDSLNYIDIWGVNSYRGYSYRGFFQTYSQLSAKPIWIGEYGADSWHTLNASVPGQGYADELTQGAYYVNNWEEIITSSVSIGGTLMEYCDEWWKTEGENWTIHNYGGYRDRYDQPDNYSNEEFWGLFKVQDNGSDIDILMPKESFEMIQRQYLNQPEEWWKIRWEFNVDGNTEGWSIQEGLNTLQVRDGLLFTTTTSSNPLMVSNDIIVNASDYTNIQIRARFSKGAAGRIFWRRNVDTSFFYERSIPFPIITDGEFHIYSIPVTNHPDWNGIITYLGLRPADVDNAAVEIDYIRITTPPPLISVTRPADGSYTNRTPVIVEGVVNDANAEIKINGIAIPNQGGTFSTEVALKEGNNSIRVEAVDDNGLVGVENRQITLDTVAPQISIEFPQDGYITNAPLIQIRGVVSDTHISSVSVNGIAANVSNGRFSLDNFALTEGNNIIVAEAVDAANNKSSHRIVVVYESVSSPLNITSPYNNLITSEPMITVNGIFEGDYIQITVNGTPVNVEGNTFTCDIPLLNEGQNLILAEMTTTAGMTYRDEVTVVRDTVPPQIQITTPVNGDIIRGYVH